MKIKDLTDEEMQKICDKNHCAETKCPLLWNGKCMILQLKRKLYVFFEQEIEVISNENDNSK